MSEGTKQPENVPLNDTPADNALGVGEKGDIEGGGTNGTGGTSVKEWIKGHALLILGVVTGVVVIVAIILGLSIGLAPSKGGEPAKTTIATPSIEPATPTPGFARTTEAMIVSTTVATTVAKTTGSGSGSPPPLTHIPRLQGAVQTTENYTAAMKDPSSADYVKLANKFITEISNIFVGSLYDTSYNDTIVVSILNYLDDQAEINFAVLLNSFYEDSELNNELTYLDQELAPPGRTITVIAVVSLDVLKQN